MLMVLCKHEHSGNEATHFIQYSDFLNAKLHIQSFM